MPALAVLFIFLATVYIYIYICMYACRWLDGYMPVGGWVGGTSLCILHGEM